MVVVATPVDTPNLPPIITRMQNASGGQFDIKVQRLDGSTAALTEIEVQFVAVEEGVFAAADTASNWKRQVIIPRSPTKTTVG
jgi:hypothetical protein